MGCIPILMGRTNSSDINNQSNKSTHTQNQRDLYNIKSLEKESLYMDDSILESERRVSKIEDLIILPGMMVHGSTLDPFEIYDYLKILGEGSFGKVSKVIHRKHGIIRAMKAIDKRLGGIYNEETEKKLIKEINILKSMDHPNIMKVYEYFNTSNKLYIITEFCSGGELFDKILKLKSLNENIVKNIMKQIFSAVNYCHLNNIIHRDLKPENILIDAQSGNKEFFNIKIIDFGTSDIFRNRSNTKIKKLTEKIGSSYYIAPEVLKGDYNEKCDLWSCGVIMYILLCGTPPFNGANESEIFQKISTAELEFPDQIFKSISYEAKEMLKFLIHRDLNKRFSAEQALNHQWFKMQISNDEDANINSRSNHNYSDSNQIQVKSLEKMADNLRKFRMNQKFQQACVGYIVHNMLKKEEIEEYRKIFIKFDLNGDGRLSKEELIQGLSQTMTPLEAKNEVERLINDIDIDKNNFIEFEEFLSTFMDKEKLLKEEHLMETFKLFDKDSSGKISLDEIKETFGGNKATNDNVWKEIMSSIDSNSDGEISYKEFKDMMTKIIK